MQFGTASEVFGDSDVSINHQDFIRPWLRPLDEIIIIITISLIITAFPFTLLRRAQAVFHCAVARTLCCLHYIPHLTTQHALPFFTLQFGNEVLRLP